MKYADVKWEKAACSGMDTQKFYEIEDRMPDSAIHNFRSVCMACPLWEQCLRYAFTNEKYGMWGGLTSRERDLFWEQQNYYHDDWQRLGQSLSYYGIDINTVQLMYLEENVVNK